MKLASLGTARTPRREMPGMAALDRMIARGLAQILAQFQTTLTVERGSIGNCSETRWGDLPVEPCIRAEFKDRTIKPGLIIVMPLTILGRLTDSFYGGTGAADCHRSSCSPAENRLFATFAKKLAKVIAAGWPEGTALAPMLTRCSIADDEPALFAPNDPVVRQSLSITDGMTSCGSVAIIYPVSALHDRTHPVSKGATQDPLWQARLLEAVMEARLPIRTVIARPELALGRVLALKSGDILPITLPTWVPLTVAGRRLAHGTIGDASGRAALKIHNFEKE